VENVAKVLFMLRHNVLIQLSSMSEKTIRVTVCPWESKAPVTLSLIKVNHLWGGGLGRGKHAVRFVR
jgi:hypothetical protein